MTDVPERLSSALADRYAIERELGQGGMATVYLAEDVRHHRKVAIKVLRPELAASLGPDRFLREIETTAQLTHPHILPLLDSGNADGTLFYVMPFVEGESLRERLTRDKQLPLEDALQIAREVADALSYAHGHGVIHRDIKPENILLESGHAVVADFGIARALSAAGGERLTETGLAIGTPAYMSPEQAAGSRDVDGRSDLYSLGCVLFEMLGGEPPYTGLTPQMIVAKKLSEPLPRISVVREMVPAGVEAALTKALARTPADRWPTAADFAAALAHPEALAAPAGGAQPARTSPHLGAPTRRRMLVAAGMVLALVAVAVLAIEFLRPKPLSISVSDITHVTSDPGVEFQPALSPDGNEVAFVAGPIGAPHLVIRSTANIAGGGEVHLADTWPDGEWYPTWSPDGALLRFSGCRAQVGPAGCPWYETGRVPGAVRPATVPQRAWSVSWSIDGARVAFTVADTVFTASLSDPASRRLAVDPDHHALHSLAWSPDGKLIAYVSGNPEWRYSGNVAPSAVRVVKADGGTPQTITADQHLNVSPVWLDARHLLFVSDRDGPARGVYAVEIGPDGPRGAPRAIPGVADAHSISYAIGGRTLAFSKFSLRENIWAYPLARSAPTSIRNGRPVTTGTQMIETHDISPDGKSIVYDGNVLGDMDLYQMRLSGGQAVPLTNYPGAEEAPRWSPDGGEIAFHHVDPSGNSEILVVPAGGGTPVRLSASHGDNLAPLWSPDGLAVLFWSTRSGHGQEWLVTRDSVRGVWHEAEPFADVDVESLDGDWAPDGAGVLQDWDSGSVLRVLSRGGHVTWRRELTASTGLTVPPHFAPVLHYSRGGRTIYAVAVHRDGRKGIWAIPVAGGAPHLVVAFDDPGLVSSFFFGVGPDRLYLTVTQYESDIWVAKLHW